MDIMGIMTHGWKLINETVPDRRRFGHVNVICAIVLVLVGGKRGKRGTVGVGKRPKSGVVDSAHGDSEGRSLQLHTKNYRSN
jgi:hypothetical protein